MKCLVHIPATGDELEIEATDEKGLKRTAASRIGFDCKEEDVTFESDTTFEESSEPFIATVKFASEFDVKYSEIINKLLLQSDAYENASNRYREAVKPEQSKNNSSLACETLKRHDNWSAIPLQKRKNWRPISSEAMDCVLLFWEYSRDADSTDNLGRSPIWHAARLGRVRNIKELLKLGGDPDEADKFGHTPLWIAAKMGHTPIVELLIKYGADPETINKEIIQ